MSRFAHQHPENYEQILEALGAPAHPTRRLTSEDYERSAAANAARFPLIVVEEGDLLHGRVVLKVIDGHPVTFSRRRTSYTLWNDRGQPLRSAPSIEDL